MGISASTMTRNSRILTRCLLWFLAVGSVWSRAVENVPEDSVKEISVHGAYDAVGGEGAPFIVTVSPTSARSLDSLPLTLLYDLTLNLLTYASIMIPGYLIKRRYFARGGPSYDGRGRWSALQRLCFVGRPDISDVLRGAESPSARSSTVPPLTSPPSAHSRDCVGRMPSWTLVLFCFFGLQISYLVWGVIQEKIITRPYNGERFSDSQFLVFMNRIIAFLISGLYLVATRLRQPPHRAPYYKYFFASFSNTMSSWFQYEALKYVSFPTQILAKASKIIPVMLMGKVVSGKTYAVYQYVTAATISLGMTIFLYSRKNDSNSGISTAIGTAVLIGYMVFDSFTSNWQDKLYREFHMTSMQMMFGVNLFSVMLTVASLLEGGGFTAGFGFALQHGEFLQDVLLLSVFSAVGQLFVYFTIKQFGPVVFITMMTVRQACAILLSCFIYGHSVRPWGIFGVSLVFIAVAFEIFAKHRRSQAAKVAERGSKAPK